MIYYITLFFTKMVYKVKHRVKYIGRKNLPKNSNFLIVSNHRSNEDPFILGSGLFRKVAFLGKASLFNNPLKNYIFIKLNCRPIEREGDPRSAIEAMVKVLTDGQVTAAFPEGTRNRDQNGLLPFKKGPALIACRAQKPIVPAVLIGTGRKAMSKVYCVFGKPFMPEPTTSKEDLNKTKNRMYEEIKKLFNEYSNEDDIV